MARAAKIWCGRPSRARLPDLDDLRRRARAALNPELAAVYEPLLTSRDLRPRADGAHRQGGLIAGMSMTEKQGGSDVRADTTDAAPTRTAPTGSPGTSGSRRRRCATCSWCSRRRPAACPASCCRACCPTAPATAPLQRLKDKLGNRQRLREVEYDGATAWLVGEEGRGVSTIIEMVNITRLDCALGCATGMRSGHSRRSTTPSTAGVRRAPDRPAADAQRARRPGRGVRGRDHVRAAAGRRHRPRGARRRASALRRIALPAQVLGVQARPRARRRGAGMPGRQRLRRGVRMPRLYREAPLLSIWEGSGNVPRWTRCGPWQPGPNASTCCSTNSAKTEGHDPRLDSHVDALRLALGAARRPCDHPVHGARKIAEDISSGTARPLLVRFGHPAVAEAFLASRLCGQWGGAFDSCPRGSISGRSWTRR